MWWPYIGAFLGSGSLCASVYAVWLAKKALGAPHDAAEATLRAFKTLEQDFEELRDRVASQLGRISRLKRDMIPVGPDGGAAAAPSSPGTATMVTAAAAPLTRSRLLALSKSKGAVTYGEEQELVGDGGRGRSE